MSANQLPCSPLKWNEEFLPLLQKMFADSRMEKDRTLAKYHVVFAIGGYMGWRPKALLSISFADLLERHSVFLRESKTHLKRKVIIQDRLRVILEQGFEFINPEDPAAPILCNRQGQQIATSSFNEQMRKIFRRYEIVTDNPSAVTLRKTYALRLFEIGGRSETALLAVQKALGHKSREYTMDYLGITRKMVAELQARM